MIGVVEENANSRNPLAPSFFCSSSQLTINSSQKLFAESGQAVLAERIHLELNGKFRDEQLNQQWFETLLQARSTTAIWRQDYNEVRPHGSIGRIRLRASGHEQCLPASTFDRVLAVARDPVAGSDDAPQLPGRAT